MSSTPRDMDEPSTGTTSLNITRNLKLGGTSNTSKVSDVIANYQPIRFFPRDDIKDDKTHPHVLSIHFDDPGELCMTAESDDTIQIYNAREAIKTKSLASKKYGVKLAQFTHHAAAIIYASTKQNNAIRYLSTHDNNFLRYFEGHTDTVCSLAMHPGTDQFLSGSMDKTVKLWDLNTPNWCTSVELDGPNLVAWDPQGKTVGVAVPHMAHVFLFDAKNWKRPFAMFDLHKELDTDVPVTDPSDAFHGFTKLEFSNNGKYLLLGTKWNYHFVLDAFDGTMKAFLRKKNGPTDRLAVGETKGGTVESSGDCCFTPDGRYVLSGGRRDVLVWDLLAIPDQNKILEPSHVLESKHETALVVHNPRFNMIATADRKLQFWLPQSD